MVVANYVFFKSAVILSEYHKGGPTSCHLSNLAEIYHFHFKALQRFLTGIVSWPSCQQLACDTSTWLNILAFAVGISGCSTILVLCLYPFTIQTYCSRGITSHSIPIKPQHLINPSTKQICIVKLLITYYLLLIHTALVSLLKVACSVNLITCCDMVALSASL